MAPTPAPDSQLLPLVVIQRLSPLVQAHLSDCWTAGLVMTMCHHQVFSSDNGGFGTLALQEWQCYTLPVDSHAEALRQQ